MANVVIYDYLDFKLRKSKIMIDNKERNRLTYVYESEYVGFFPIDKQGFRDVLQTKRGPHNYSWTMELHTRFLYRGGEYFDFRGDDDIYLFIDGKLEMDLGGIHGPAKARVELDKIPGLQKGRTYSFDLFFCERQSSGSSLGIEGLFVFDEPDPVVMGIIADRETFIPGEKQVKISVIGPAVEHQAWLLGIWGTGSDAIRIFKGKGEMKKLIEWDGKDENGKLVQEDKEYRVLARGMGPEGEEWESNLIILESEMKLITGKKIAIGAINFEPYSYTLTSRSKIALDRVYKILKEYPIVRLLIKGHVASINWSKERLLELSQNRAEAVMQYLVDQGIDPGRLESKGYGDTQPVGNNDSEEGRKLNRRTEFEVISSK